MTPIWTSFVVFFPHGKNVSVDKLILSAIRIERVKVPHTRKLPRYLVRIITRVKNCHGIITSFFKSKWIFGARTGFA